MQEIDWTIALWRDVDDCSVCPFEGTEYCSGSPDGRVPCRDNTFDDNATCDDAFGEICGRESAREEELEREWQAEQKIEKKKKESEKKRQSTNSRNRFINRDINAVRKRIAKYKAAINFSRSIAEAFSVVSSMIDRIEQKPIPPHPLEAEIKPLEEKLANLILQRKEANAKFKKESNHESSN
ncbi:hypothetical protein [Serratia fonticola]|uniref:hypothetical protein n=1 Tax=Serratia fonticola TaxID=47917 RepID=UPI0034C612AA